MYSVSKPSDLDVSDAAASRTTKTQEQLCWESIGQGFPWRRVQRRLKHAFHQLRCYMVQDSYCTSTLHQAAFGLLFFSFGMKWLPSHTPCFILLNATKAFKKIKIKVHRETTCGTQIKRSVISMSNLQDTNRQASGLLWAILLESPLAVVPFSF